METYTLVRGLTARNKKGWKCLDQETFKYSADPAVLAHDLIDHYPLSSRHDYVEELMAESGYLFFLLHREKSWSSPITSYMYRVKLYVGCFRYRMSMFPEHASRSLEQSYREFTDVFSREVYDELSNISLKEKQITGMGNFPFAGDQCQPVMEAMLAGARRAEKRFATWENFFALREKIETLCGTLTEFDMPAVKIKFSVSPISCSFIKE